MSDSDHFPMCLWDAAFEFPLAFPKKYHYPRGRGGGWGTTEAK